LKERKEKAQRRECVGMGISARIKNLLASNDSVVGVRARPVIEVGKRNEPARLTGAAPAKYFGS